MSTVAKFLPRRAHRGFTLLELVMVLVIIGVILSMVGPRVFNSLGRASSEQAKIRIEQIGSALELYKLDTGRFPSTQEGLGALLQAPSGAANWNGPYLRDPKALKDPWARDFIYRSPVQKGGYELASTLLIFERIVPAERTSILTTYNLVNSIALVFGALIGGALLSTMHESFNGYLIIFGISSLLRAARLPETLTPASVPMASSSPASRAAFKASNVRSCKLPRGPASPSPDRRRYS